MALYIPHSIFHLGRLLYVRPETFGPYYVAVAIGLFSRGEGNIECQAKQSSFYIAQVTRLVMQVVSASRCAYSFRIKTSLQIRLQCSFIKDTEKWQSIKRIHFRTTKL